MQDLENKTEPKAAAEIPEDVPKKVTEGKNFADIQTAIKIKKLIIESNLPIAAPPQAKASTSIPKALIFMNQPHRVLMSTDDKDGDTTVDSVSDAVDLAAGARVVTSGARIASVAPSLANTPLLGMEDVSSLKVQKGKANIRTDFFAARLASAVDDVETSDSDETFVYENSSFPSAEPKLERPDDINRNVSGIGTVDGSDEDEYERDDTSVTSARHSSRDLVHITSSRDLVAMTPIHEPEPVSTVILRKMSGANIRPVKHDPSRAVKLHDPSRASEAKPSHGDANSIVDRRSVYSNMHRAGSIHLILQMTEPELQRGLAFRLTGEVDVRPEKLDEPVKAKPEREFDTLQDYYESSSGSSEEIPRYTYPTTDTRKERKKRYVQPTQLRTTTSKVFDRKGSQPRRYSIIPDNVDIEDFEDELIYYDSYKNRTKANETTQLLSGHRRQNDYQPRMAKHTKIYPEYNGTQEHYTRVSPHEAQSPQSRHSRGLHFALPRVKSGDMPFGYAEEERLNNLKSMIYTVVGIFLLLSIGFISGFLLATLKDLQHVHIFDISHVVVSQDELVFNMWIEAFNPGFLSIDVSEATLDIFAKSEYVDDKRNGVETILLGSIDELLSSLSFSGGFFNRRAVQGLAEVKLLNPGQNVTSAEEIREGELWREEGGTKWSRVAKHPFDLIVSGVLKYKLPLSSGALRSVVVNKVTRFDPADMLTQ
ncbi:hypothetical protein BABINDRAFT_159616 [Babjeviella inositovora NRRL Y-12698]|uniref:Vacuolar segregation protein 7 n=1 Tax=Babjeviella inositovora NRRL Y-12698 TaxID=984486 RepID=A0A1E3R001_9ASCO|nr:uncharacterized protein BABINDRAFT_159616 [Babjeviella inositovora NRRL Y-12698]ODQ83175.1 hypothetical protein BABINDRAFT_159616 [Babjeviella inositovora NRRL Y-12698]